MQAEELLTLNEPAAHGVQEAEPGMEENEPAGQVKQLVVPELNW